MRKYYFLVLFLFTGLVISSCNSTSGGNSDATTQSNSPLTTDYEDALTIETQLVFGILQLDGTENAVDAEQATQLLALWKAVRSLSASDSAASEETEALFVQIQETLTLEQIQAIAAMQLTQEDMAQITQERGIELFGGRGQFGDMTPEMQATMQAFRESGQMPEGNFQPPEGGFGGGGNVPGSGTGQGRGMGLAGGGVFAPGGTVSPEMQSTAQARRASGGGGMRVSSEILDVIIQYLQDLISSGQ